MFNRNRRLILVGLLIIGLFASTANASVISPELQSILLSLGPHEEIPVIVALSDKADIHLIKDQDKRLRRLKIITALKSKTDITQRPLRAFLENRNVKKIKSLWLINGMAITASASVIRVLATLPEVETIRLDEKIQAPEPIYELAATPEWNLAAIRVHDPWDLGFTGQGVVVANMDTGVDVDHPDLQSRWRGGFNGWYDPNEEHDTPHDVDGHGTNTMGIIVGGDFGGSVIGVVPGATWIAVKIFNDLGQASLSAIHQGFQWLLDPDGNPDTDDAPDVVNNSWGLDNTNRCFLEFESDVQVLKAAGIAVVFAAGNSGPSLSTSISPANNPGGFAAGAVDQTNGIASFSSRGPSTCDGGIYPELVAPGVSIKTSDLTFGGTYLDSYAIVSGTSYSAPHVTGAMALLLSAFPELAVSEIELALRQSALDLGLCGADNDFGNGLLDVMKAYQLIINPAPDISICFHSNQFGTMKEGNLSSSQMFTVTNKGIRDLVIGAVSMAGENVNDFIVQSDGCSSQSVASGGSCLIQIAFLPISGGRKGADLSIESNDPDQSPFFVPLIGIGLEQHSLSIMKAGSGSGKVIGTSTDIDCGGDCSELYTPGTAVTLKALSDVESTFGGWSGCKIVFGTTCRVVIDEDKTVTANFVGPSLTVISPNGGEGWKSGSIMEIRWSYTGNPGSHISIELLKGDDLYTSIRVKHRGRKGIGSLFWRIPKDSPPGNDYKIRISSTINGLYTDMSDNEFRIFP
jgi:bacillopeptidase F